MRTPEALRSGAAMLGLLIVAAGCTDTATGPRVDPVTPPLFAAMAAEDGRLRDHVILLAEEAAPSRALLNRIEALGGTVTQRHDEIGVLFVSGLEGDAADVLLAEGEIADVGRDFDVQWIPPVDRFDVLSPEDLAAETDQSSAAFFPIQWNMRQIRADATWKVTPQGKGTLVCVLDTGIDPNHIDLQGKIDFTRSVSFFPDEPDILDRNFHGTFVSALVTSNGLGMASVAPDTKLCVVKIAGAAGRAPFASIIAGFVWTGLVGADAANISFGGLAPKEALGAPIVQALQRAVNFAFKNDVLIVASAGNDAVKLDFGSPLIHLTSGLDGVVSVGATAPVNQMNFDALASYTNFGRAGVNVMAPGGDLVPGGVVIDLVLSACSGIAIPDPCAAGNFYLLSAGTSFAAPHATGAAAVIESAAKLDQGAAYLRLCLFEGADRIDGRVLSPFYGRGRINVLESVKIDFCGGAPDPDIADDGPAV